MRTRTLDRLTKKGQLRNLEKSQYKKLRDSNNKERTGALQRHFISIGKIKWRKIAAIINGSIFKN